MPINWQDLRTLNGSQHTAFEELCCQLASCEQTPPHSRFVRKGAPDAGVECFWLLPNSVEWGWQAKFFLSSPSDNQWQQIDHSVRTALDKHPQLGRYIICLPIDRQDPRDERQRSFMDKWEKHVRTWEEWASERGMAVVFDYWGAHEMWERLSREEHKGRFYFWFHKDLFSEEWFGKRLQEAVANVGPRYTPELDVQLPIGRVFHGLGRTQELDDRLNSYFADVRKNMPRFVAPRIPDSHAKLDEAITHLLAWKQGIKYQDMLPIGWEALRQLTHDAMDAARGCIQDLTALTKEQDAAEEPARPDERLQQMRNDIYHYQQVYQKLTALNHFTELEQVELVNLPAMLLVGAAGTGKTHLLCDVARQRLQDNLPTVLVIGDQFDRSEPWSQIIRLLGLSCSREEFLGALESAAQSRGARALVLIDGLNEGEGKRLWKRHLAGMLLNFSRSPWLGIAISVRSSYEDMVIPEGLVPNRLIRILHSGFASHEYEAAKTFFDYFGIQRPSVPLLVPEFQNPLFLKMFCQAIRNAGLRTMPHGLRGISSILHFFIDSVNRKLSSVDYLDFNPKASLVWNAVDKFAATLAERRTWWLPIVEAQDIIDRQLPQRGYESSLYRHLLAEGLLAENRFYVSEGNWVEGVHFGYERFTDHLIAKHLLDTHIDGEGLDSAFQAGHSLSPYVSDRNATYTYKGLIEALSVQVPERYRRELVDVVPCADELQPVQLALIESLVWREPDSITEQTFHYLNRYLGTGSQYLEHFLDSILTLAAYPDHPCNADLLHHRLMKDDLAERDAWWSVYLHQQYRPETPIDRLVEWAWTNKDKQHIEDESARLLGITLAWFLTSSNRFLRDRSTKALISLFTNRASVFVSVLNMFWGVNDPYVIERLMAVAYGCAMRTSDNKQLEVLARTVYERVFENKTPPPHILLRDYARGTIEMATARGIVLDMNLSLVRPPYKSGFPDQIPSKDELEEQFYLKEATTEEELAQDWLWHSVMSWGDFARYIIGLNGNSSLWSTRRLGDDPDSTPKERHDDFVASLTPRQMTAFERYKRRRNNIIRCQIEGEDQRREWFGMDCSDDDLALLLKQCKSVFVRDLGKKKGKVFLQHIEDYLENPQEHEARFDLTVAQRWILNRVFELGWTREKFGQFDRGIVLHDGRETHKPERIGKKYQWIAYHEFLARLADNYEFKGDFYTSGKGETYEGPWQSNIRDIDPSWLLSRTKQIPWYEAASPSWWAPVQVDWTDDLTDREWIRFRDDLPSNEALLEVADPSDGSIWSTLEASYQWGDKDGREDEESYPKRRINLHISGYVTKKTNVPTLSEWIFAQKPGRQEMPNTDPWYRIFFGELFWAPAVSYYSQDQWVGGSEESVVPSPVHLMSAEYMQEGGDYDCSIDDSVHAKAPSRWLADSLNLHWTGIEGSFHNRSGELIAFDPSVHSPGRSTLLVKRNHLMDVLAKDDFAVVWVVTAEKLVIHKVMSEHNWPGRLWLTGVYHLDDSRLTGEFRLAIDD